MNVLEFVKGINGPLVIAMAFALYVFMGIFQSWTDSDKYLKAIAGGLALAMAFAAVRPWMAEADSWLYVIIDAAVVFFLGWGGSFISNAIGTRQMENKQVDVPRDVAGGSLTTMEAQPEGRYWWSRW